MRYLFLFLFCLLAMSVSAQQKEIIQPVTLSGLTSGRRVVIQEVLDHAALHHQDPAETIVSYEVFIASKKPVKEKVFKVSGPEFSAEARDYLQSLKGKKGRIVVRKIMTERASAILETPYYIELTFIQ